MTRSLGRLVLVAVLVAAAFSQVTAQTQVSPDNAGLAVAQNQSGLQATFTVWSGLQTAVTRQLIVSCSGQVAACSVPSQFVTFTYSTNVQMTFSSLSAGAGTLVLQASGGGSSDQGSYNVTVRPPYGVAVTPDGGTAPTRAAGTGGYSEPFTVTNSGTQANTFSFACTGAGGVTCGTLPAPVSPAPNGGQATVNMPYSVGAAGTGTLTLTATGTSASDAGSYSVPIVAYGVSVTPDGVAAPAVPQNTTGYTAVFTVQNTGSTNNTFSFACSSSGSVSCGTLPAPVPLGPSPAQATVSMPYSVGGPSMGGITLTANGTNASDPGSYTIQVMTFVPSTVSGGSLNKDSHYILQETANSYDVTGRITQLTDPRGNVTDYVYGAAMNNAAFLVQVKRWTNGPGSTYLSTDIGYTNGFPTSIRDEGGTSRYFVYDSLGRLRQIKNNDGVTVVKAYGYTYSRTSPNWTFNFATPNAVIDTTFQQQTPSVRKVVTVTYVDGLGRSIEKVANEWTGSYLVTATQYDLMGRVWRTWKPYRQTTAAYDQSFAAHATSFYNSYLGRTAAVPYDETLYMSDPLDRVKQVAPETDEWTAPAPTVHRYDVDGNAGQSIFEFTDGVGNKRRSYRDGFGNEVKTVLGYGASEATTTLFSYNVLGQRTQVTDPRSLITTYTLNTRGLLSAKTSPDAGTVNHKYDRAGNLRFTQDAKQAAADTVYFTSYDFANRPLTSGQGAATFSSLDPDASAAFEGTQANWLVVRAYDAKPATAALPWSLFSTQINAVTLNNVTGRLAAVASKSNGAWQVTLLSYDADGHLVTRYTYTQDNTGATVLTALNTRDSVQVDLRGAVRARRLTIGTTTFNHAYYYNDRGLLQQAAASTGEPDFNASDVTYNYHPGGQVQNIQFLGGPVVPLNFTIRDQLAQIGNPAATTYPFSASYTYNSNGTVAEAQFYNAGSPAAQKRYKYAFPNYDALSRLKSADFSSWSGTAWTSTLAYDLAGIAYDAAGNVTALQRYRQDGTLIDNLTYNYASNSNRLTAVTDAVTGNSETWDARSGSFTYDPNGNVAAAPAPYSISAVAYDPQNLPLSITRSGTTTKYRYDEAGQRITKQVGGGNTEVYIREGATTLAVFTVNSAGTPVSWYFNVLTDVRVVGRQPNTGNRSYYHTDALGSTRAVVQTITVVESYDFDPWGLLMPGRTLGSGTKEGFTGKEQDAETGLDYFGARYYMPALGRWAAVDPLADKSVEWSPYAYVKDSPIWLVDPTGLQEEYYEGAAAQEYFRGLQEAAQRRTRNPEKTPLERNAACQPENGGDQLACLRAALTPIKKLEPLMRFVAALPSLGTGALAGSGRFVSLAPRLIRVGEAAAGGKLATGAVTFYRGVTLAEGADISATGALRAGEVAAGNTGKYLTNSATAAARWGAEAAASSGSEGFQVWQVTVHADAARVFTALGRIDAIGEAWWAPMEALGGAQLKLVTEVLPAVP